MSVSAVNQLASKDAEIARLRAALLRSQAALCVVRVYLHDNLLWSAILDPAKPQETLGGRVDSTLSAIDAALPVSPQGEGG